MRFLAISILILVPAIGCNRTEEARRQAVAANLKQIELALQNYHRTHQPLDREFSHIIAADTDYYTTGPQQGRPADGEFQSGTKVDIVEEAGSYVLVQSETGVKAYVAADVVKQHPVDIPAPQPSNSASE